MQVHVKNLGHAGVYMPEKIEELLVTMTSFALTQDRSSDGVEGREQCDGAVSDVVGWKRDPSTPDGRSE